MVTFLARRFFSAVLAVDGRTGDVVLDIGRVLVRTTVSALRTWWRRRNRLLARYTQALHDN
jgi:hypothetical protein